MTKDTSAAFEKVSPATKEKLYDIAPVCLKDFLSL